MIKTIPFEMVLITHVCMEYFHTLQPTDLDLSLAIAGHSADECVAYKYIDGQPYYLGFYFPQSYDKVNSYPAFVFIHGGGWSFRKIFDDQPHWQGDYLGFLARYYANKGFVSVSIDYRLIKDGGQADGFGLIDCYEDCCDAMDFLYAHAKEYGIDPSSVYLLGESAGGYLAGAVATFHYDRQYSFKTTFLINPISDLNDPKWGQYVSKGSNHKQLIGLSTQEMIDFLSPVCQADEKTSPIVLIHGSSDVCVDPMHAKAFHQKMSSLSNACDLHLLDKTNHAFLLAEYTKEQHACRMGIRIIDHQLHYLL